MHFPILSALIFTPIVAGVVLLALPAEQKDWIRRVALAAAVLILLMAFKLYFSYDPGKGGYQFLEEAAWLPQFGISYKLGIDGISLPLVLLSGLVIFSGVLVSWNVEDRPREFFSFLMFLGASVLGVFCALDLFLLFFFFELAVFPKYLMIVVWGYPKTREYGGMKLTLYLFIGSVIALVGTLAVYFGSGLRTFDLLALEQAGFPIEFQRLWFPFVFLGFAILGGIFPFHSWAPDGHVAAPTAISMLLAGVEMKVGAFAALRVGIQLLPEGAQYWAPAILLLATINVVYGAFIAMVQTDFKYVIGFSSVSHMGLVLIGFATLNRDGLLGAGMQMFSHGVMTALFFAIVGMVYDRAHTREIGSLGGLVRKMPWAAVGFIIGGLVSMGMPGFSGFVSEIPVFMGAWQVAPLVSVVAILGILITAAYIFLVVRRVFFGEIPPELDQSVGDVSGKDKLVIGMLSLVMILLGWFPSLLTRLIEPGVHSIVALMGGGW
ncbi:NADH-quinone oxidoreductase subunit M [Bellilinea sp.]|uniref:complex I subunit 4 family protein n=1 Tax=Bellilinea sp. TaxID=2838785 RepID=UPI002ADE2575|nr:NADH-quinone oxidoreductase subunit M [Bellilinea sp.]